MSVEMATAKLNEAQARYSTWSPCSKRTNSRSATARPTRMRWQRRRHFDAIVRLNRAHEAAAQMPEYNILTGQLDMNVNTVYVQEIEQAKVELQAQLDIMDDLVLRQTPCRPN